MTTRYFSATDGTFTVFRATASAAYASASWLGDRPYPYCLGFSRKPAGSGIPGRFPTTEISKAQYDALVAAKQDRQRLAGQDPQRYSSPQDSWVRNADLKARAEADAIIEKHNREGGPAGLRQLFPGLGRRS